MSKKITCPNCHEEHYPHNLKEERVPYEKWPQTHANGFVAVAVGNVKEVQSTFCPMCGANIAETFFTE